MTTKYSGPYRFSSIIGMILAAFLLAPGPLDGQQSKNIDPSKSNVHWAKEPYLDGKLEGVAWLPKNGLVPGGYDNVLFIYDHFDNTGDLEPPGECRGGDEDPNLFDPPLSSDVVANPDKWNPRASGFNLYGVGVAWHPESDKNGAYYLALDLPGSSNLQISEHHVNPGETEAPVAFDADGDGDPLDYNHSAITNPGFSDATSEDYSLYVGLGSTIKPTIYGDDNKYGNGLGIWIHIFSDYGDPQYVTVEWKIPWFFTETNKDIVLNEIFPKEDFKVEGIKSDPDKNIYDIEIRLPHIYDIIELEDIDWTTVDATPGDEKLTKDDCRRLSVEVTAGATSDLSKEEAFGYNMEFPAPMTVSVDKTVGCSDCGDFDPGNPPDMDDFLAYGIPDAKTTFQIKVEVTSEPTGKGGKIHGKDILSWFDGCLVDGDWRLCEDKVIVEHPGGKIDQVSIPGFNLKGDEWVVMTEDGSEPYLFKYDEENNMGDILIIPFEVHLNSGYGIKQHKQEIHNYVTVWGDNGVPGEISKVEDDDTDIDVLVPDLECFKYVYVDDSNGGHWDSRDEDPKNVLVMEKDAGIVFPITVTWCVDVVNTGETWLENLVVTDEVIEDLGGVFPKVDDLEPGGTDTVCWSLVVETWDQWCDITNDASKVDNLAEVDGNVMEDDPDLGHLCVYKTYKDVYASSYDQHSEYGAHLTIKAPEAEVAVTNEVSCSENGPWSDKVHALPGAEVYFKITVSNTSNAVPVEHAFVEDTKTGPIECDEDPSGDWGAIPPGQSLEKIIHCTVKGDLVKSENDYEIVDHVDVDADGPDCDEAPDPGAHDEDEAKIAVCIPALTFRKEVLIEDADQNQWGPGKWVNPDKPVKFPLKVKYFVYGDIPFDIPPNDHDLDIIGADLGDGFIEKLCQGVFNPPIEPPDCDPQCPPLKVDILAGEDEQLLLTCTWEVDDKEAFDFLAAHDADPNNTKWVDNITKVSYDTDNLKIYGQHTTEYCGTWSGEEEADAHFTITVEALVPALTGTGLAVLCGVMMILVLLKTRR